MTKLYLVWFRLENDQEDKIRGGALNWERAEKMALNLEFYLKSQGYQNFEFGVKSYEHGSLPLDFINTDGCYGKWTKEEFDVEPLS